MEKWTPRRIAAVKHLYTRTDTPIGKIALAVDRSYNQVRNLIEAHPDWPRRHGGLNYEQRTIIAREIMSLADRTQVSPAKIAQYARTLHRKGALG